MVTVTALTLTLESRRSYESVYLVAERSMLIAATAALAVGLTDSGAKTSLMVMVALLLGTVYTGLRVWAGIAPEPRSDPQGLSPR
jgi:hypothetical protein